MNDTFGDLLVETWGVLVPGSAEVALFGLWTGDFFCLKHFPWQRLEESHHVLLIPFNRVIFGVHVMGTNHQFDGRNSAVPFNRVISRDLGCLWVPYIQVLPLSWLKSMATTNHIMFDLNTQKRVFFVIGISSLCIVVPICSHHDCHNHLPYHLEISQLARKKREVSTRHVLPCASRLTTFNWQEVYRWGDG